MKTHRSFKTGSKTIRYTYDGHLRSAEQQAIDKFIGMAYNMSMHAIKQFEKQTAESVNFFKMIYGKDADAPGKIVESYKSIIQHIERGLKIRREKVLMAEFQEIGPQAKAVLASKLTATKEPLKQAVKQRKVKPQIK